MGRDALFLESLGNLADHSLTIKFSKYPERITSIFLSNVVLSRGVNDSGSTASNFKMVLGNGDKMLPVEMGGLTASKHIWEE